MVAKLCATLATPWTTAGQAPLSMGFPLQEYWRGLPFPSPGDLLDPAIKPVSPVLQAASLPTEPPGKPSLDSVPRVLLEWPFLAHGMSVAGLFSSHSG